MISATCPVTAILFQVLAVGVQAVDAVVLATVPGLGVPRNNTDQTPTFASFAPWMAKCVPDADLVFILNVEEVIVEPLGTPTLLNLKPPL